MLTKRQDDIPCFNQGNSFPFCSPVSTDVWNNGTTHAFVWNFNYPFYVASPSLDLFLYYKERFAYQNIKNWTNLPTHNGQLSVQVDDSWFPTPLTNAPNQTWTLYGFYLPSGLNPYTELTDTNSQYPRPFNFSAVQYASPSNGSNGKSNGSTPSTTNSSANSLQANPLPGWAIAVITIAAAALVLAILAIAVAWCVYRRRKQGNKLSPTTSNNASAIQEEKAVTPAAAAVPVSPSRHIKDYNFNKLLEIEDAEERLKRGLVDADANVKQAGRTIEVANLPERQGQSAEELKPSVASPTLSTASSQPKSPSSPP